METEVARQWIARQTEEKLSTFSGEQERFSRLLPRLVKDGFGPILLHGVRHQVVVAHRHATSDQDDVPIGEDPDSLDDRFHPIFRMESDRTIDPCCQVSNATLRREASTSLGVR